jgi:hypothetical protein
MNARNVQAVLAAGVQDPSLLSKWQTDPAFLRSKGIDPATMDLAALRKFAGLSIKVKHNGLRFDLPLTFRLMGLAELDIGVFSAYATYCAENGRRLAKTSAERACDLVSFLETWLDPSIKKHSLLWDMIRHEQALAQLKNLTSEISAAPANNPRSPRSTLRGSTVPHVRGHVILHRMQCDPGAIASALFQRPFRLDQIPQEAHFYCYWRAAVADEVHILDLDEFGFYALTLIDGVTSVAELSRRMGGGRRPTQAFLGALQQFADIGILHLHTPRMARKK